MPKREYKFNKQLLNDVMPTFTGRFLTQSEQAKVLGISQSSMSRLSNGQREPTINELIIICNNAKYSPADFFNLKTQ